MEFFITFLLVTVILLVALDSESKTALASLLIGFTLAGNILAVYVRRFMMKKYLSFILEENILVQV
jgi:glycerol uptake facilitator-like aquaporin